MAMAIALFFVGLYLGANGNLKKDENGDILIKIRRFGDKK